MRVVCVCVVFVCHGVCVCVCCVCVMRVLLYECVHESVYVICILCSSSGDGGCIIYS